LQIRVVVSGRIPGRPQKQTQPAAPWAVFCCCLLFAFAASAHPQGVGDWAWMGGQTQNSSAVFGTLGTPAAGNIPEGRNGASNSTDHNGNLWLFGGEGATTGWLNDLWKFNPSTNEWTWMGGSDVPEDSGVYGPLGTFAAENTPGARYNASTWVDSSGNLWLFGGNGFDQSGLSMLNDLWEFNPSTGEWAWMGGSDTSSISGVYGALGVYGTLGTFAAGNTPGGREGASSWQDKNGNFWLFGGMGYGSSDSLGWLNDVWEFNPSTKEWAWMAGSSSTDQAPVYGTLGVPAAGNTPGPRELCAGWTDSSGNFWLFGGGFNSPNYNDLWEFNPSTKEWAWMGGSSSNEQSGVYGALGTPAAGNTPGSRDKASSWTDSSGNFWLFGGLGYDSAGTEGALNDLWKFSPSTKEWTWVGGSSTVPGPLEGQPGVYGILGTPAAGNTPGGRIGASNWTDNSGNLWFFGGTDLNGSEYNDMWKYQLYTVALPAAATPTFSLASGTYTTTETVKIADATAGATIYYNNGGFWTAYTGPIAVSATETIKAIAMASGHSTSAVATVSYTINLPPAPAPTFSLASGTYTGKQTVTISDAAAGASIYYTTNGTAPTTGSTLYTGAITVYSSETVKAIAVAPGYSVSAVATATYVTNVPATTTTVTSSLNPSNVSEYVTFTATVKAASGSNIPAGTVQFTAYGAALGSPVALNSSGAATYTTAALYAGGASITAIYTPSSASNFAPSTSAPLIQSVYGNCAGITATTLTSSLNPSTQGQPVTFSATVAVTAIPACVIGSPVTGTGTYAPSGIYGTVQFTVNGLPVGAPITVGGGVGLGSVSASYTTSTLAAGTDVVGATFTEENGYVGSSSASPLSQVVTAAPFGFSVSPSYLAIAQCASGLVTLTQSSFVGAVNYTFSGLPSGVTVAIDPVPTAAGVTIYTVSVSCTAAEGVFTVTVTGSYGGQTATGTFNLGVTGKVPQYTVSASPASLTLAPGASGSSILSVTGVTTGEFPGGVTYEVSNLPSGVTASFSFTTVVENGVVTLEPNVLTLSVGSTATVGTYAVTVSAFGNLSSTLEVLLGSTTIALTVTAAAPPACTIDYVIEPQNTSAFGATLTIINNGSTALSNWTLSWNFANGQTISSLWNGVWKQTGAAVTVTNESYNGSIPAGGSYTGMGFNANWNGVTNTVPTAISLNGVACVVN
jgi:N-acetylneuraminic acid mutarotase